MSDEMLSDDEKVAKHRAAIRASLALSKVGRLSPNAPQGMKFDGEKPRLDLLFNDMPHAVEAIARVLTQGAVKYAPGNWQHVPDAARRYQAAGLRHELALAKGQERDEETGEHHLAHAACCLLFRLELALREQGEA